MSDEIEKNRYLCIVRNIRNNMSRAWNKRTPNRVLIAEYFGVGMTSAHEWCKWLGIDAETYNL